MKMKMLFEIGLLLVLAAEFGLSIAGMIGD